MPLTWGKAWVPGRGLALGFLTLSLICERACPGDSVCPTVCDSENKLQALQGRPWPPPACPTTERQMLQPHWAFGSQVFKTIPFSVQRAPFRAEQEWPPGSHKERRDCGLNPDLSRLFCYNPWLPMRTTWKALDNTETQFPTPDHKWSPWSGAPPSPVIPAPPAEAADRVSRASVHSHPRRSAPALLLHPSALAPGTPDSHLVLESLPRSNPQTCPGPSYGGRHWGTLSSECGNTCWDLSAW